MIFDYMTLKVIWWGIILLLMIAFAITGGMDIGVNILLPIVGKTEDERRYLLNAVGPTWEGNQVWLITFGATLFAVWPTVYATAFSSLYFALYIVVFMLILRPPGIDYRSKIDSVPWRAFWDRSIFAAGLILALVFGVAIGNLFVGLPFTFDQTLRVTYSGSFWSLFTPFTLLFGIVSLSMLVVQGGIFLQYKLEDELAFRAKQAVQNFGKMFIISFVAIGVYINLWLPGFMLIHIPDLNTSFGILDKTVALAENGWLANYTAYPLLWLLPCMAVFSTFLAMLLSNAAKFKSALACNSLAIICTISTAGSALFPFVLPSSSNPQHSLTIWDAASSYITLAWTFYAVLILLPIVLLYTAWVYKVMRGKVQLQPDSY